MQIEPAMFFIVGYVMIGGALGSLAAHLCPVGGAPAAMGTATGIATGTVQILLGAVVTGLFTAATVSSFTSNILYGFGCGVLPISGRVAVDPITKAPQAEYKTPQTDGHGVPDVVFVSGILGGLTGGFGGALIYFTLLYYSNFSYGTAVIVALSIFVANAILAAYNVRGTIEGFQDPKFKKLPNELIPSIVVSFFCGLVVLAATIALGGL
jgi:tetrahydromethanopterin S-methyltransferase subunit D